MNHCAAMDIKAQLIALGVSPVLINGCTEADVQTVVRSIPWRLPDTYKKFLRVMGRSAGPFLADVDIFYPAMVGLTDELVDYLNEPSDPKLPEKCFVFSSRQGEQFLFMDLNPIPSEPSVYRYMENALSFEEAMPSFEDFLIGEFEMCREGILRRARTGGRDCGR